MTIARRGIKGQRHSSKSWVGLMRSVQPRSRAVFSSTVLAQCCYIKENRALFVILLWTVAELAHVNVKSTLILIGLPSQVHSLQFNHRSHINTSYFHWEMNIICCSFNIAWCSSLQNKHIPPPQLFHLQCNGLAHTSVAQCFQKII